MALPLAQEIKKDANQDIHIDRSRYDVANKHNPLYEAPPGVSEETVRIISTAKNEPEWMLKKRLAGLELYNKADFPTWGPDISQIIEDIPQIKFFVQPRAKETTKWEDLPDDIRKTYERIGIPEAVRANLFSHTIKTSSIGTGGEVGTGLGLPLCRDIAKMLKGEIHLNEKVTDGTAAAIFVD